MGIEQGPGAAEPSCYGIWLRLRENVAGMRNMNYTFYELAMLFFAYSFLAWLVETVIATVKERNFRNRGFLSGPFCFLYGLTGVILTVFLQDLRKDAFFLFAGSMAVGTAVQWFAGKTLERIKRKRWWDYSGKRGNFDGYICLQYSVLWGILGVLAVRYGNGILLGLYDLLPGMARKAAVWGLIAIGFVDFAGTLLAVWHVEEKLPRLLFWNRKLQRVTYRLTAKVAGYVDRRIGRSYPAILQDKAEEKSTEACGFVQIFWMFVIGAFVGDIVETIFCRLTSGIWMSRSSLVWGPFSVVWGLAIALATVLLYKDKDRQDRHIFWVGVFLGGAYEYVCSVFTEIVFGKVFWDYSAMPFNLGGRINLLYCFFWGIAAVVWIKGLYPKVSRLIDGILHKTGQVLTLLLMVFMTLNILVSMLALVRYDTRAAGKPPVHKWEQSMDEYFDDERMERIYPNGKACPGKRSD